MKLIIDIPEEVMKATKAHNLYPSQLDMICENVLNGTPIPDNATVCDLEQISSARYNNGLHDGKKAMEEKLEQIRAEILAEILFEDKWLLDAKSHNENTRIAFDSMISKVRQIIDRHTKGEKG